MLKPFIACKYITSGSLVFSVYKTCLLLIVLLSSCLTKAQEITIDILATEGQKTISPYIYGRNNNFSDALGNIVSQETADYYSAAGLRFARENSGNNATKYNWRKKLSSHPDWYNNVYDHDWDNEAYQIVSNLPNLQVMYAFQVLGKVADNKDHNFNDWGYNSSQWWEGVAQNLAGGGEVNDAGGTQASTDGNPELYLTDWPADSTTAILSHWFGSEGLGYNPQNFVYWSMDNEPEIWNGTHDDVMPVQIPADEFMSRYFQVAKKARELYPDIKLCGPVPANEWQWYRYAEEDLQIDGEYYCWLEYFIKRVADEEQESGIRLLDVLDIHWYPSQSNASEVVQLHRVFYDENFDYPGANGVKTINGGWDNNLTNEYILARIESWLNEHFGENHGIGIGISEFATNTADANVNAVTYASFLGTFADHGVEYFAPWNWKKGMWETLHLFSRYAQEIRVQANSSQNNLVSGYSSINNGADSLTLILVNRDLEETREVTVNINGFEVPDGSYSTLTLANLPATETFISHTENALDANSVNLSDNTFTLSLPPLSTSAVLLSGSGTSIENPNEDPLSLKIYPNPASRILTVEFEHINSPVYDISVYSESGKLIHSIEDATESLIKIDTEEFPAGNYIIKLSTPEFIKTSKFVIIK